MSDKSSSDAVATEPLPEMPKEVSRQHKVLRVAVRMLMDFLKVLNEQTRGFEIGCKCKDEHVAAELAKIIEVCVGDLPCIVSCSGYNTVVIKDTV